MASISWEMTSNREKICCGEKMFFFPFRFWVFHGALNIADFVSPSHFSFV